MRELAPAVRGGITQPSNRTYAETCTTIFSKMSSHVETRFSTRHLHCPHKGLFILMSEVRHRWRKPIAQRFNPPSYGAVPPIAERERERSSPSLLPHNSSIGYAGKNNVGFGFTQKTLIRSERRYSGEKGIRESFRSVRGRHRHVQVKSRCRVSWTYIHRSLLPAKRMASSIIQNLHDKTQNGRK